MEKIIELAQQELNEQRDVLESYKEDKEIALNEALKAQQNIAAQETIVSKLANDLAELTDKYGQHEAKADYQEIPAIAKHVKPAGFAKKALIVTKDDLITAINKLSSAEYRSALKAINNLEDCL